MGFGLNGWNGLGELEMDGKGVKIGLGFGRNGLKTQLKAMNVGSQNDFIIYKYIIISIDLIFIVKYLPSHVMSTSLLLATLCLDY